MSAIYSTPGTSTGSSARDQDPLTRSISLTRGDQVAVGAVRQFDSNLYRVVQAHTTQADWTPPTVPALWTAVRQTEGPTVDPWVQPTGSQDAYQVGDRVTFEGQTYESTAANNVWQPGVFGWVVVQVAVETFGGVSGGTSGTANTGGGAAPPEGGNGFPAGGSGIFIIRYAV